MFLMVFIADSFRLFPFDIYRIAGLGQIIYTNWAIHDIDTNEDTPLFPPGGQPDEARGVRRWAKSGAGSRDD